ncbi:non-ribosomal peptide synthetase [Lysobacter enzymogenes]|uniref:non-ribosomal peptide synthetase n=1 Tax=Lysobacter enzymogenes TaxID=69 RepID=UPI00099B47D0|nr:non-ribosomal peptide synthetase [Lysobacter enzymogenes]UZW58369.1 non-ribosomal peptide synthetase [Lysobacter enzymogenes]
MSQHANVEETGMLDEVIEGFRLSPQQRHLWLAPPEADACAQCAIDIEGELSPARLDAALQRLTERHEALRTGFRRLPGMDVPVQVPEAQARIRLETREVQAPVDPARAIGEQLRLDAFAAAAQGRDFPGRCTWLKFAPAASALLVTLPSLCADAASLANLHAQLAALCADDADAAAGEFVQYADYSEWQNERTEQHAAANAAEYWNGIVDGGALALEPPPAHAPPGAPEPVRLALDPAMWLRLKAVCGEHGAAARTGVLAALGALAWRLRGREPAVFAVSFDGRAMQGLADAIGPFAKHLPVQIRIEDDYSFIDALRRTGDALAEAETVADRFTPGSLAPPPIAFDWHAAPAPVHAGGLKFALSRLSARIDRSALAVSGFERDGDAALELHYDPAVYSAEAVELLAARLATLLTDVAAAPERPLRLAELLPAPEYRRLLADWNRTDRTYPDQVCLHELFERQAQRTPDAGAVVCAERALSFAELDRAADALAHTLRRRGVRPDTPVGVCLERSCWMLVAILGIWKAGGAYVPIDPAQPRARLAFLAADAGCRFIVTQQRLAELLADAGPALVTIDADAADEDADAGADAGARALPEHLAYVLYTSGSTGTPQGVMVRHAAAVNLAFALQETVYRDAGPGLTVAMNAPLVFDASVKQLIQVVHGHRVCLIPEELRRDPAALADYLALHRVDAIDCTPSQLNLWLAAGLEEDLGTLPATVLIGGEAVDERLWRLLAQAPGKRCWNVYGPTECTVDATVAEIRDGRPSIGAPLGNVRAHVLDEAMNLVPTGAVGQLYVGGAGLARGYLHRPRLTAQRFVPDPFACERGARLYRTGDLVRRFGDGRLEYLRRTDHQVKVQGIRIELPEIEKALREHPAVREAAVVVAKGEQGAERMLGYVLPQRTYRKKIDGHARLTLPDGRAIVHRNKNESEYLYQEIFERRTYLRNGIRLPPGAVVFDVGANIGMFSMFVAAHCPDAELYAFEPIPPIFESCRINCELYAPAARLFPFGLSARSETASFTYYPHYSMMSGREAYSDAGADIGVIKRYLSNQGEGADSDELLRHADEFLAGRFLSQTHDCPLRRLSEVIASENIQRIDLLKIDVQRAEMDVLAGIDEADWARIEQIVIEVHDGEGDETAGRTRRITELLQRHGFETRFEQDGELTGTDRYNFYASRRGLRPGPAEPASAVAPCTGVLTPQELRAFLKERLPSYMVPSSLTLLEEMPLTRNGKIDRVALAATQQRGAGGEEEYLAPQTGLERAIAEIWQQVLGLEQVGRQENFFDLGGQSLLLVQLHRRLCDELGAQILMLDVFQHPTVAALAELLQRKPSGAAAEARLDGAQARAQKIREAADQRKQASQQWKDRL